MNSAIDSSIIVAAMNSADPDHKACLKILIDHRNIAYTHSLSETFSTLTGGRLGFRIPAAMAAEMLRDQLMPRIKTVSLDADDLLSAYGECESRGIRGGAIYDYLHLVAARKAGAKIFQTLNESDFLAFHRPGDPMISVPNT